jgi:hypothetical protein
LLVFSLLVSVPLVGQDQAAPRPLRGILIEAGRATPEILATWKGRGVNTLVVPLDESMTRARWSELTTLAERAGLTLDPWIEVARNPALADAHPEWMASPGGHHNDWRRRFPDAPVARPGAVLKTWPWVPIGYAPAYEAHRQRIKTLLDGLPGSWSGLFLNDLQAGPSSCGCGNDQCRWALDYGSPATAPRTPGEDAAARLVAELREQHPGRDVIPVWVTECEMIDLPNVKQGTGHCGSVECAKNTCWPRYVGNWNPLTRATDGPLAVALWPDSFRRETGWVQTGLSLFMKPPRGGRALAPERTIAVLQGLGKTDPDLTASIDTAERAGAGWVVALDPVDQSWEPRLVSVAKPETK